MKYLFTILSLFLHSIIWSQNLIPNPSFEQYNNCPNSFGQIACPLVTPPFKPTVNNWISAVPNSPDYYNSCSGSNYADVPNNFYGTHPANTGDAYVGIAGYSGFPVNGSSNSYREYVECKLLQPLIAGEKYEISCYVRLAYAFDPLHTPNVVSLKELGAHFSNNQVASQTTPLTHSYTPMTNASNTFFSNSSSWQKITGTYLAKGGEEWLTIGVFNDKNVNPDFSQVFPPTVRPLTTYLNYYLIDDVSLTKKIKCDTVTNTFDTIVCNKNSFPVSLSTTDTSTGAAYSWSNNATSPSISVNNTGLFWCKSVKGCNLTIDSFHISLNKDTLLSSRDTLLCTPQQVTLRSRDNAIAYKWNNGDITKHTTINDYGKYWCISLIGCKQYIDTIVVKNKSFKPNISLGNDIASCNENHLTIGKQYAGVKSYSWNTGDTTCCISPKKTGTYILTIKDECNTLIDTIHIKRYNCTDCFFVPDAFTPNNDGLNDAIGPIPKCDIDKYTFKIFSRWGELVFETNDLNKKWNGIFKNRKENLNSFYYFIQFNTIQDQSIQTQKGDILLIR